MFSLSSLRRVRNSRLHHLYRGFSSAPLPAQNTGSGKQEASSSSSSSSSAIDYEEDEDAPEASSSSSSSTTHSFLEKLHVPRNQPLLPALLDWIRHGNQFRCHHMKALMKRLEWQNKYSQALEVSEWALREKPFQLLEIHHSRWVYYVGKVRGLQQAEEALLQIPVQFQGDLVCKSLFHLYLERHKLDEATSIIVQAKSQGPGVIVYFYNNLISYYDRNGLSERISLLLNEMKEEQLQYNRHTYNILLASKFKALDITGLEEIWDQMRVDSLVKPDFVTYSTLASAYISAGMLDKAEVAVEDAEHHLPEHVAQLKNLNSLVLLYGALGREKDVARLYSKLKALPGRVTIPVYMYAIEAYGESGKVDDAEQVVNEMEVERGWHHICQYNALLGVYCKSGLMNKAQQVLKNLLAANHKPNAITYIYLLLGYLKIDHAELVNEHFDFVVSKIKCLAGNEDVIVSRIWLQGAKKVIEEFARKGDIMHVNMMLNELEAAKFHMFPKAYAFVRQVYEKSVGMPHVLEADCVGS